MASLTFRKSTKYGTEPYAVLTVKQSSQDKANNRSYITYSLVLYRPSNVSSSASKSYSITINGSTVKSGTYTIGGKGTKTIASGNLYVSHNSNGAKTLSFGASVKFAVTWSGTYIGTITKSGSMTLTTISRDMPTLSFKNSEGTAVTTLLADDSTQYTAVVAGSYATGANLTFGDKVINLGATGKTFTIPLNWNNLIPLDEKTGIAKATITASISPGSATKEIAIQMPESIGTDMGEFSAYLLHKTDTEATIQLIPPTTFQYGATFGRWELNTNAGTVNITGNNIATLTKDATDNTDIKVSVRAVDSRGFISKQEIIVPCYIKKRGFCIYDGTWRQATPYVYMNGKMERMNVAVYMNNKWNYYIYRT